MRIFDLDSPIMRFMSMVADLLWLNVLALICCLPLITAGASLTAMHYMALKLVRGEEGNLTRGFFRSFKQNFKQSTALWLIMLLVFFILGVDVYVVHFQVVQVPKVLEVIVVIFALVVVLASTFIFPLQAKFDNPVRVTIKNAVLIGLMQSWRAIIMVALNIVPIVVLLSIRWMPLAIMFGISAPAYFSALVYNKYFKKLEELIKEANGGTEEEEVDDDEKIFSDKLDEGISINENYH